MLRNKLFFITYITGALIASISTFAQEQFRQLPFPYQLAAPDSIIQYYSEKNKSIEPLKERNELVLWTTQPKPDTTFSGKDTIDLLLSDAYDDTSITRKHIIAIRSYIHGVKTNVIGYYESGGVFCNINFDLNSVIGIAKYYRENCSEWKELFFDSGKIVSSLEWYLTGELRVLSYERDSGFYEIRYFRGGGRMSEEFMLNTAWDQVIQRRIREYYPNGNLKQEYSRGNGKLPFIVYYESGKKKVEGWLKDNYNNAKVGIWKEYYENGKLKSIETYKDTVLPDHTPIPDGKWTYWNVKGKIVREEVYLNGILVKYNKRP